MSDIKQGRGFTLFELIVVVFIVALMSSLAAPRLVGSLTATNLRTATRKVGACLRYGRNLAAANKTLYRCEFDAEKGRLQIKTGSETPKDDLLRYRLPVGIRFIPENNNSGDTGVYTIVFFPNGSSSGGRIYLRDKRNREMEVLVDRITGFTSLGN